MLLLFLSGPCSHTVQKLKLQDVSAITVKTLKVIPDRIIDNYNKRQQPRFRCDSSAEVFIQGGIRVRLASVLTAVNFIP